MAKSMQVALSGKPLAMLAPSEGRDSEAYLLYLQGREYLRRPAERKTLEIGSPCSNGLWLGTRG